MLPAPIENSLNMRRMMGDAADVAPLHPEPGDIWAGIVPTQPPEALTPFSRGAAGAAGTVRVAPAASPGSAAGYAPGAAAPSVAALPALAAPPPVPARRRPVAVAARPAVASPMRPAPQATTVQLAAAGTAQNAVQAWQALQKRLPRLVRGHPPEVSSADVNGRMVWRLRTRGFATIAEADSFCARVRAAKSNCWVVGRSDEP
jgi:hypothetical protein